ncbi:MAG: outer membrane protein transport protein [Pseudoxanthomonas sp.]
MQHATNFIRYSALAAAVALAAAAGDAHGAAFQLKENSAKGLGRAYAGSASAPGDASVVATNPAAMRLLDGRQLQADVNVISFSAKFQGQGSYLGGLGGSISGGNGGDAGTIKPVPSLYFHQPFGENDDLHFGVSVTVPFGFKTEYDKNWVGRYSGIKTQLQAVDLGAAFSYDVNPYVSFGGSVFAERLSVDLTQAIDFGTALYAAGASSLGFAPGNADGFTQLKADDTAYGFTLGTLLTPVEGTNIGFTYRSQVRHKITDGNATFSVPAAAAAVLGVFSPGAYVDTKGSATIVLPASATASFTHRINDRWTVMADVSRTAWSKFDKVVIDYASTQSSSTLGFYYRDTTFASLGADYKVSDTLTLRAGVAYDQTPTTDAHRDVRVPDASRKWLALGLSWTPSEKFEYNLGYVHLFTSDPKIDETSVTASTLVGSYEVSGDVLGVSMNYKF